MKFDEILERAVKEVSKEYGIKEEEIWGAIAKFKLRKKIRIK